MNRIEDKTFVNLGAYAHQIDESKMKRKYESVQAGEQISGEKVELSKGANRIAEAKKLIQSIADIREDKVSEIKEKIASGTYQYNFKKAASGMLAESLMNDNLL